jgi:hypothetical protein
MLSTAPTTVRVLASVPAGKVPVVALATPVDPILTAIERNRIAYVAFVTSVNRTKRNAGSNSSTSDTRA